MSFYDDFLNPFFAALGWDIANTARLIQKHREVEIESRTQIAGRQKRADYLFRVDRRDRFVCEAKKPAEELNAKHSFQAKRYAWNKELPLAILTDFEDFKLFIVGGKPHASDALDLGLFKKWHFLELPAAAQEIWDLLARDSVAAGSIEKLIEGLPKRSTGKGKYKQGWLIKPDRSRSLDVDFLNFLDEARRELASDLLKENDRADLLEDNKLNEATQRILDRILFLRICEDRDIDTGLRLDSHLQTWRRATGKDDGSRYKQNALELHDEPPHHGFAGVKAPKDSLWRSIVRHFRNLDRRPPSHVPFFNGNLFKAHFSEELLISDEFLARFIGDLSDDESPYLFAYIPVEILGTIYERFLGKVVRPHGRGVTIEEKPEVRKAGGVYYTPRYIVEYIVAQTVEKLLADKKPEATLKLRFLDPACGSGSFLIRVFEAACEYWQQYLTDHPKERKAKWCWTEKNPKAATDDVHLTMSLKREILLSNVYGVDLDPGAVEVTQLSLYLKMLENENRNTLDHQRSLLPDDDAALLPPLENNIKCGNSLIASDFSMMSEDLVRVRAFDWNVGFRETMLGGGFDCIVGNPPYGADFDHESEEYIRRKFQSIANSLDSFIMFVEHAGNLLKPDGLFGMIIPSGWVSTPSSKRLRLRFSQQFRPTSFVSLPYDVFDGAYIDTIIVTSARLEPKETWETIKDGAVDLFVFPIRHKIETTAEFEQFRKVGNFPEWIKSPDKEFLVLSSREQAGLVTKLRTAPCDIDSVVEIMRGIETFHPRPAKECKKPLRAFNGEMLRYELDLGPEAYEGYPSEIEAGKPIRFFSGPRILLRQLLSRKFRLQGVFAEEKFLTNQSVQSLIGRTAFPHIKTVLGILNSRLLSWYFCQINMVARRDDFPKTIIKQTRELPFPCFDPKNRTSIEANEQLVSLVEKVIKLNPKLRAATSDRERQTLQNAVTATDQQIDALVYELYGLTAAEIKIVEGLS